MIEEIKKIIACYGFKEVLPSKSPRNRLLFVKEKSPLNYTTFIICNLQENKLACGDSENKLLFKLQGDNLTSNSLCTYLSNL